MRKCQNCFTVKPLYDFYRKLTGHQYRCKSCNAEVVAGYYLRQRERKAGIFVPAVERKKKLKDCFIVEHDLRIKTV